MKNKIRMLCLMQEHAISDDDIKLLEGRSNALYQHHFGYENELMTIWVVIPRGQAYIAGKPSTATTVTLAVENGTDNESRHPFMSEFCQMWMDTTDCHENEIILNVTDKYLSEELMQKNLARINPTTRFFHIGKQLLKMVKSKALYGYFSINFNFNR